MHQELAKKRILKEHPPETWECDNCKTKDLRKLTKYYEPVKREPEELGIFYCKPCDDWVRGESKKNPADYP